MNKNDPKTKLLNLPSSTLLIFSFCIVTAIANGQSTAEEEVNHSNDEQVATDDRFLMPMEIALRCHKVFVNRKINTSPSSFPSAANIHWDSLETDIDQSDIDQFGQNVLNALSNYLSEELKIQREAPSSEEMPEIAVIEAIKVIQMQSNFNLTDEFKNQWLSQNPLASGQQAYLKAIDLIDELIEKCESRYFPAESLEELHQWRIVLHQQKESQSDIRMNSARAAFDRVAEHFSSTFPWDSRTQLSEDENKLIACLKIANGGVRQDYSWTENNGIEQKYIGDYDQRYNYEDRGVYSAERAKRGSSYGWGVFITPNGVFKSPRYQWEHNDLANLNALGSSELRNSSARHYFSSPDEGFALMTEGDLQLKNEDNTSYSGFFPVTHAINFSPSILAESTRNMPFYSVQQLDRIRSTGEASEIMQSLFDQMMTNYIDPRRGVENSGTNSRVIQRYLNTLNRAVANSAEIPIPPEFALRNFLLQKEERDAYLSSGCFEEFGSLEDLDQYMTTNELEFASPTLNRLRDFAENHNIEDFYELSEEDQKKYFAAYWNSLNDTSALTEKTADFALTFRTNFIETQRRGIQQQLESDLQNAETKNQQTQLNANEEYYQRIQQAQEIYQNRLNEINEESSAQRDKALNEFSAAKNSLNDEIAESSNSTEAQ